MTTRTIIEERRTIGESKFRVSLTHDSDRKSFSMSAVKVNVKGDFESCMLHEIQFLSNVHKAPRFSQKAATEAKARFEEGAKALTKKCLLLELKKLTSEDFGEPNAMGNRQAKEAFVSDQDLIEKPMVFSEDDPEVPQEGFTSGQVDGRHRSLYLRRLEPENAAEFKYEVSVGGV